MRPYSQTGVCWGILDSEQRFTNARHQEIHNDGKISSFTHWLFFSWVWYFPLFSILGCEPSQRTTFSQAGPWSFSLTFGNQSWFYWWIFFSPHSRGRNFKQLLVVKMSPRLAQHISDLFLCWGGLRIYNLEEMGTDGRNVSASVNLLVLRSLAKKTLKHRGQGRRNPIAC